MMMGMMMVGMMGMMGMGMEWRGGVRWLDVGGVWRVC